MTAGLSGAALLSARAKASRTRQELSAGEALDALIDRCVLDRDVPQSRPEDEKWSTHLTAAQHCLHRAIERAAAWHQGFTVSFRSWEVDGQCGALLSFSARHCDWEQEGEGPTQALAVCRMLLHFQDEAESS